MTDITIHELASGDYRVLNDPAIDGYAVVVNAAEPVPLRELGSTNTNFGQFSRLEYRADLTGDLAIYTYDEMRRSDAQVRATLRLLKAPILSARWFMEPASESEQDQMIADYVWWNLNKGLSQSFVEVIREALIMLDFGHYHFEKVFDIQPWRDQGPLVKWKKFAPRHPLDLVEWHTDPGGGVQAVTYATNDSAGPIDEVTIEIMKLLLFTFEEEAGDKTGMSLLRSAYKHWYMKDVLYKIDAIQKERHGVGVPVIKLPVGFTVDDKRLADEMGRSLRSNEKAHIVLPPNWEILTLKIEGQTVNVMESIEHHDLLIARNVLGQFINVNIGNVTQTEQQDIFLRSAMYVADIVRTVFNKWAIPQLVDWNWDVEEYPELRVRRVGETIDWRTMSFTLRNLIGAAAIKPDDPLEVWLREELDLPKMDPETAREVATPQLPDEGGTAFGQPRQSTAGNMGGSSSTQGDDASGG